MLTICSHCTMNMAACMQACTYIGICSYVVQLKSRHYPSKA